MTKELYDIILAKTNKSNNDKEYLKRMAKRFGEESKPEPKEEVKSGKKSKR